MRIRKIPRGVVFDKNSGYWKAVYYFRLNKNSKPRKFEIARQRTVEIAEKTYKDITRVAEALGPNLSVANLKRGMLTLRQKTE